MPDPKYIPPDSDHPMSDGGKIHLYMMCGTKGKRPQGIDSERNVHRYDKDGRVVWVIQKGQPIQGDWSSYVGFETMPDGALHVHASDGCVYSLNVDTGEVTFLEWEK